MIAYLIATWTFSFYAAFVLCLFAWLDHSDNPRKQAQRVLFWIVMFLLAPITAPLVVFYGIFKVVQRVMPLP